MKYEKLLVAGLLAEGVVGKNVVDLKARAQEGLAKRDAKRITGEADLRLSDEELDRLFNPLNKRDSQVVQIVEGAEDEISRKQRLFEQGVDVMANERAARPAADGEFHILEESEPSNTLANAIVSTQNIGIFSRYARSSAAVDSLLCDSDRKLVIFTPTDNAIAALPLKPWEYPTPVQADDEEDKVSSENIGRFVKSHVVDGALDLGSLTLGKDSGAGVILKTMNNINLKFYKDADAFKLKVQGYDNIVINVVAVQEVDNGALLVIDHVLEWPGM